MFSLILFFFNFTFRIFEQYKKASENLDNDSLALVFYDLDIPGQPKDQFKFLIFLLFSAIILAIAIKKKLIQLN